MQLLKTRIAEFALLVIAASTSVAQGLAPPAFPSDGPQRRVLHLLLDAAGRVYTTHHVIDHETGKVLPVPVKQIVTDGELQMLRELGIQRNTEIMVHPEQEFYQVGQQAGSPLLKSSGSCALAGAPYYGAITFWTVSGTHYGAGYSSTSSNRGSGESTQWVSGNFQSYNYTSQGDHSGVDLLWGNYFNGGGLILGDRSGGGASGCSGGGLSAQIEFWGVLIAGTPYANITDPSTCRYPSDGTLYSFAIQTQGTYPTTFDTTYWLSSGGTYLANGLNSSYSLLTNVDTSLSGLAIFNTTGNSSAADYSVYYTSLSCGWF